MAKLVEYKNIKLAKNYAIPKFDEDLSFDAGGKWEFVTHIDKLAQNILAELTLEYNPDTDVGNSIFDTLKNNPTNPEYVVTQIRRDFRDALLRIQYRQDYNTPAEERLSEINNIDVSFSDADPTEVGISILVTNILQEEVALDFVASISDFSFKLL